MTSNHYRRRVWTAVASAIASTCAIWTGTASADPVYQCKDSAGKVTFSNVPCSGTAPTTPAANEASDYTTLNGEWHGQTQFRETISGVPDGTLQAVANLTIQVDAGGKVAGTSTETGCKVLGLAAPGAAKNLLSLDLTLSACSQGALNRRYSGTLALYPQQKVAALMLISAPSIFSPKPAVYDIKATMKR